jgi:predicted RNase H-like HicB family nuclease
MQYQIFVQNPTENRFAAFVFGVLDCFAEGATEAEALAKAEILLEEQLAKGKVVTVDKPTLNPVLSKSSHAALIGHGMFKDDPTFDDFLERMSELRQQADRQDLAVGWAMPTAEIAHRN